MAQVFPGILDALADGRLHITAVLLLAPRLKEGGAELLKAAEHKTKPEILELLAERYPRPAVEAHVTELAPERVPGELELASGAARSQLAPERVVPPARVTPLAPEMYALRVTIDGATRRKLEYAKALLGHQVPSGDLANALDRALDALVERLEKRFGLGTRRRAGHRRPAPGSRHIAMEVRHDVYVRDDGCCTSKSACGRRCQARTRLQFDHVIPFARGGESTVDNLRLRCREHNQHGAEQTYGAGFMEQKRNEAREAQANKQASRATDAPPPVPPAGTDEHDVYLALRTLGMRDGESRRALVLCADIPEASREDKLRRAPTWFPRRCHGPQTSVSMQART